MILPLLSLCFGGGLAYGLIESTMSPSGGGARKIELIGCVIMILPCYPLVLGAV